MVSKLTIKLIAAASSLALLANGGGTDANAQTGQSGDSDGMGQIVGVTGDPRELQVASTDGTVVGSTDIVKRDARGILEQNIRELKLEDNVFFSEVVETGEDSALRITLLDKTTLTLGPTSRVVLDEFVYDPATNEGRLAMRLISGVFRFTSGLLPKSNYSIGTPVGDIGIRGTVLDLWIFCSDDQEAELQSDEIGDLCQLTLDVDEGSVALNPGPGETVAGEGQRVEASTASDQVDVGPIPPDDPIIQQVRVLRQLVHDAAFELLEGELPGNSIANANDDDLSAAIGRLLQGNENLAVPIIEAVTNLAPARASTAVAAVVLNNPELADTVAAAVTNSDSERRVLGLTVVEPVTSLQRDNSTSQESPAPYTPGGPPN